MTEADMPPTKGLTSKSRAIRLAFGAVIGLGVGFLFERLVLDNYLRGALPDQISNAALLTLVFGAMLAGVAVILLLMSFNRKMFEAERDQSELDPSEFIEMQPQLRLTAVSMLATTAGLTALALPFDPANAAFRMLIVIVSTALQLGIGVYLWRRFDELHRAVTLEGSTISYVLLAMILTIWAAASMFGYGLAFDPLAVVLAINLLGILPTLWLAIKNGMAK